MLTRGTATKSISAGEAAGLVRSGDWLDYGAVLGQPDAFDRALAERAGDLHNVNIRACLSPLVRLPPVLRICEKLTELMTLYAPVIGTFRLARLNALAL